MSTREYAMILIDAMSDEQVDSPVNFIVSFSGVGKYRQSDTEADSWHQAFKRIKDLRSVSINGEKAVLQEYREEMCAY